MNRMTRFVLTGLSVCLAVGLAALGAVRPRLAHAGGNARVERTYPWHSDSLALAVPADVQYHPGATWRLTISAPPRTLRELVVSNGRIGAQPHSCFSLIPFCISFGTGVEDTVHVDLTGPALRVIDVAGSAKIQLDQLHQDRLAVTINGSAAVQGTGTVNDLSVVIHGAGTVQLGQLSVQRARVHIDGSGTVAIAPTDSVSVRIDGAGKVRLHSDPAHVSTQIEGAGSVSRAPAG